MLSLYSQRWSDTTTVLQILKYTGPTEGRWCHASFVWDTRKVGTDDEGFWQRFCGAAQELNDLWIKDNQCS